MKKKFIIPAAILASLFVAGTAGAQSAVSVTTNPVTNPVSSGSGVYLGTVSVSGPYGSTLNSVPVSITAGGGASNGSLSNCQLYNSTGTSVTTGGNVVGSIGAGQNTFMLNNAQVLSATPVTYTVRCDVAAGTPTGSTFGINVAAVNTNATPPFVANLDVAPSVPAGSQDVALANISLGTGAAQSVRITSVPLSVSSGSGALAAHLTDCRVRNSANVEGSLTGSINPAGGTATYVFATPLTITAGSSVMLSFTCDVSAATPIGGTFTVGIEPSGIVAVDAVSGTAITPTAVVGTGPNGLPAATSGTIIVSAYTGGGDTDNGNETPGVPNTGAGDINTLIALAIAGIIALGGTLYLRTQLR